jgi:tRNA pseudouridine13 synthase
MTHPYLTSEIPGIGGSIKNTPDDFCVTEIPSYFPSGSGEHCYLTIEKRGITTLEAIHRIAAALKVAERDIGYAGMKDAVGVTRQIISIQRITPQKALDLELNGIKVLSAERHSNKLKLGHLKGNHFRIALRGISEDYAMHSVPAILAILSKRGVPNYFGPQRYGVQGNSHLIGAALLRRDWQRAVDNLIGDPAAVHDAAWSAAISAYRQGDLGGSLQLFPQHCRSERDVLQRLVARPGACEKAFGAVHPRLKKLYLSALQSFLFDQVVAARIDDIDTVICGDLACKHLNGACFLVTDQAAEQGRAEAFEISASGPLFGCRMKQPQGASWHRENEILQTEGIELNDFDLPGGLRMEGERRPLRVPAEGVTYTSERDCIWLEFSLPRGSYATALLRELMKCCN